MKFALEAGTPRSPPRSSRQRAWSSPAVVATATTTARRRRLGGSGDLAITFLPKNLGNPYFDTSDKGGKTAVEEFGGTFSEVGPSEGQPRRARCSYINTPRSSRSSALVVSANDKTAICDALNEARDAGAKVVTFDSDTNPDCRDLFINQATAEGIAKVQIDLISEQIGDGGEIAILSATRQRDQPERLDRDDEEGARGRTTRNIKLVDTVYGDDDDQKSFDKTAGAAARAPRTSRASSRRPRSASPPPPATCPTRTYKGKVALTGLGTPNQMREYVKDGTVSEFALWNPDDLGYLAAYAAEALVDGEITGEEGDKFKAGKLGEYTVGEDGDGPARRPVHVQQGQHRRLQLLIRSVGR